MDDSTKADLRNYALQLELNEPKGAGRGYRKFALNALYTRFPIDKEELYQDLERLRETRDNYDDLGTRRAQLINKEFDGCLNRNEKKELKQLNQKVDEYMAITHPLPFGPLKLMEQKAKELAQTSQTKQQ